MSIQVSSERATIYEDEGFVNDGAYAPINWLIPSYFNENSLQAALQPIQPFKNWKQ
ncbi:MAG: hypothetical protein WA941_07195 [Nitrososphaeraceae archaeon]